QLGVGGNATGRVSCPPTRRQILRGENAGRRLRTLQSSNASFPKWFQAPEQPTVGTHPHLSLSGIGQRYVRFPKRNELLDLADLHRIQAVLRPTGNDQLHAHQPSGWGCEG